MRIYVLNLLLSYGCGTARKFLHSSGEHIDIQSMTCQWNKSWTPSSTIMTCDWIACFQPPAPPKATNLKVDRWFGKPVAFGEKILYVCDRGMKFEDDPDLSSIEFTCQDGEQDGSLRGFFNVPKQENWPKCVPGKSLSNPL